MKTINYELTDEVRDVLGRSTVTGHQLRLPEQLDRKPYLAVAKAIELMGGKWDKKQRCHFFRDADAADVVADAVATGTVLDFAKTFQFYESPPAVCKLLCDYAALPSNPPVGFSVLEPSAGRGAIVRELNALGYAPDVYELADENRKSTIWNVLDARLRGSDFLPGPADEHPPRQRYDRVIANPPFSRQQDVVHVARMIEVCKPGGRVVSVMSPGWRFRSDRVADRFRNEVLAPHKYGWHPLPDDSFLESGAAVRAGILVVDVRGAS